MSVTTVEITSETRQLEAGFDKIERLQKEQEAGYEKMAVAGKDSARQIAAEHEASSTRGAKAYELIIAELRRQGPEGREQAKAIEGYLKETGTAGRRSIADIVAELGTFDEAAAAVSASASEKMIAELNKAEEAATFQKTLDALQVVRTRWRGCCAVDRSRHRESGSELRRVV